MRKTLIYLCLGLFFTANCVQTLAESHSFGLTSEHTHIHVADTHHHHDHQNDPHSEPQENSTSDSVSAIYISYGDAVQQIIFQANIQIQHLNVSLFQPKKDTLLSAQELIPLRNSGPPDKKAPHLPYFSLAPPQFS